MLDGNEITSLTNYKCLCAEFPHDYIDNFCLEVSMKNLSLFIGLIRSIVQYLGSHRL